MSNISAAVTNSPKLALPERAKPKRLGTNLGAQPRLGIAKNEATASASASAYASGAIPKQAPPQSPALSRWRRAVNQVNIELLNLI